MALTDHDITITEFLEKIFVGDDEWKKTSSIPKIIFVDTCHGPARDHSDMFFDEKPDVSKSQSKSTIDNEKPPPSGGVANSVPKNSENSQSDILQQQRSNVENLIIIHASVQQNTAYQYIFSTDGSEFLKGLCKNTYFLNNDLLNSAKKDS